MQDTASHYLERLNSITLLFQAQYLTQTDICLLISLRLFPDRPACGIGIFELGAEGSFRSISSFGLTKDAQLAWASGSIARNSPVVEAMRTGEVVCISSNAEMYERYPEHAAIHAETNLSSVIAVPIRKLGSAVGALVIIGSDVLPSKDALQFVEVVAGLIALKINSSPQSGEAIVSASNHPRRDDPLTNRERLVQEMMRDGKTNIEIGEELGYSESTIRQDAVSMFIKLGVKNRKSAGSLLPERKD